MELEAGRGDPDRRRLLILAAGSLDAAARYAATRPETTLVLARSDVRGLLGLRKAVEAHRADSVAVHTPDWRLQRAPQLYEVLLASAPVRDIYLVDEAQGAALRPVSRAKATLKGATLPLSAFAGLAGAGAEALRLAGRRKARALAATNPSRSPQSVLAIWIGEPGNPVGGSVTHISGILGGFRQLGLRVGLVTFGAPPEQLACVVDDVELAPPLPPRGRVTSDIESLLMNSSIRRAVPALARRLPPGFLYQRHRAFLVAGVDASRASNIPLVLEWNSSELWVRAQGEPFSIERIFRPLLALTERYVLERAHLTVAVSAPAAQTARELGARPGRVVVVPNGVDVSEVATHAVPSRGTSGDGARIGWIGSFGAWHGAEVLVRALTLLSPEVTLLMVGDGVGRPTCRALAEDLGVGDRIEWAGVVPHDEALRLLASCDVLASPHVPMTGQEFFGSPTKIFEYMAVGRPIVASALGQISDVLEDGVSARLVTPGDVNDLAHGIREVLESADRGAALGRGAQDAARSRHTWESRARDIVAHLPIGLVVRGEA
jgi:glycosyltransferase involved in cell wall biosynthesis